MAIVKFGDRFHLDPPAQFGSTWLGSARLGSSLRRRSLFLSTLNLILRNPRVYVAPCFLLAAQTFRAGIPAVDTALKRMPSHPRTMVLVLTASFYRFLGLPSKRHN